MTVGQVKRVLGLYEDECRVIIVLNEHERLITGEIDLAYLVDEEHRLAVLRGHVIDAKE